MPTPPADAVPSSESAGFQSRGRARRRARFLRKARELAYRDLGGLVFNLHRFGQRNDALVLAKLTTLGQIDAELRTIEGALGERRAITVLREAGITACPRCAAIHSSEDSFCPNCGLAMDRHADLPIAGAAAPPAPAPQPPPAATGSAPAPQPAPSAPAPTPAARPAPAAPDPAREPVPATPLTGRSPVPPATDRPTEILHPPVSGS
ncbi:MAG: zinc ribbon domain-containing protein [Solirubrobacteraceae bacterium]